MKTLKMNLVDMVLSFTAAMDSVSAELQNHHKRVTNIAANIAMQMKLPEEEVFSTILAARLHDIGAISVKERKHLTDLSFDDNYTHAVIGYKILQDFEHFAQPAKTILYHHRPWDYGRNKYDNNGVEIPMGSWIIHLADRIDIAMNQNEYPLAQRGAVNEKLSQFYGKIFHPDVVEAYEQLAGKEYFWLDINTSVARMKYKDILERNAVIITEKTIADLGRSFSRMIDFRNKFTSTHSTGVSASAEALTRHVGFDSDFQSQMRIAGFLHDLGKIVVPIHILEKNGPLDLGERLIINSHTYFTHNILSHVPGLEDINRWASFHHEKLDGSGYPFHLKDSDPELDTPCRIMMIADVFTALTEDRPYRKGMERHRVESIIKEWVEENKLDKDIASVLFSKYDEIDEERKNAQAGALILYDDAIHQ